MQTPHDKLFCRVFADARNARFLLEACLPPALAAALDWAALAEVSGRFLGARLRERRADLLFLARLRAHAFRLLILVEHKSGRVRWAPLQSLRYRLHIWEKWASQHRDQGLPPIVSVMVHHGPRPVRVPKDLRGHHEVGGLAGLRRADPVLAAVLDTVAATETIWLYDLARGDETRLRRSPGPPAALLALLCLQHLRGQGPGPAAAALARWAGLLQAMHRRAGYGTMQALMAYILEVTELTTKELTATMGKVIARDTGDMIMSTADKLRAEGRAEAKAEAATRQRRLILRLLHKRFGAVSAQYVRRIEKATPAALDAYGLRLLDAKDVAAVFAGS